MISGLLMVIMDGDKADRSKTLALLQRRIDELQSARAEIDLSLDHALSEYGRIANQMAPVYSLPDEILAMIFEAGCHPPQFDFESFQMPISHVTRRWRDVSINTASIWTDIYIHASKPSHIARAATYLIRSKSSPLKIILKCQMPSDNDANVALVEAACYTITPHVDRCQELYVQCNWSKLIYTFFDCFLTNTPAATLLRCVEIDFESHIDDWEYPIFKEVLFPAGAPSLASVRLRGIGLHHCQPPVASLETLYVEYHPSQDIINSWELCSMLRGSSALTHMTLVGDGILSRVSNVTRVTLDLPSLRCLAIRPESDDSQSIAAILIAISAPKLECMTLESVIASDLEPFFLAFDASAGLKFPLLRSLTLCEDQDHGFTLSTWGQLMHAFPTITHFTLSYETLDDFLLSLQEPHTDSNPSVVTARWPNLHTLSLSTGVDDVHPILLLPTVLARIAAEHPIHKLRLSRAIVRELRSSGGIDALIERVLVEQFSLYPNSNDFLITWKSGRPMYSSNPV